MNVLMNQASRWGIRLANGAAMLVITQMVTQGVLTSIRKKRDGWNRLISAGSAGFVLSLSGGLLTGIYGGLCGMAFIYTIQAVEGIVNGARLPALNETIAPIWRRIRLGTLLGYQTASDDLLAAEEQKRRFKKSRD